MSSWLSACPLPSCLVWASRKTLVSTLFLCYSCKNRRVVSRLFLFFSFCCFRVPCDHVCLSSYFSVRLRWVSATNKTCRERKPRTRLQGSTCSALELLMQGRRIASGLPRPAADKSRTSASSRKNPKPRADHAVRDTVIWAAWSPSACGLWRACSRCLEGTYSRRPCRGVKRVVASGWFLRSVAFGRFWVRDVGPRTSVWWAGEHHADAARPSGPALFAWLKRHDSKYYLLIRCERKILLNN
jgi:hypothetical protein